MSDDDVQRIYRMLDAQAGRLDTTNARLAGIEGQLRNPPIRPCPDFIVLREEHRGLITRVGEHLKAHVDNARDWRSVLFSTLGKLAGWAAVAFAAWVLSGR